MYRAAHNGWYNWSTESLLEVWLTLLLGTTNLFGKLDCCQTLPSYRTGKQQYWKKKKKEKKLFCEFWTTQCNIISWVNCVCEANVKWNISSTSHLLKACPKFPNANFEFVITQLEPHTTRRYVFTIFNLKKGDKEKTKTPKILV